MYFALGFLIAGLLTLLILPAFWRRAVRLSTRRLEMQLPLSMDEIVAERDQLRAGFALEHRHVEQRAEDLAEGHARDLAELGRRSTRIGALESELVEIQAESGRRADRLATLGAELAAAQAEVGVAHQVHADLEGRLNNKTLELAALLDEHQALSGLADERRAMVAGLETRVLGHEADNAALRDAIETIRREHLDLNRALGSLTDERDIARAEAVTTATRRDQALAQVRELQERVEALEQAHRTERRGRMRMETEAASRASALTLAEARESALRETHAGELATLRGREQNLLRQIETLKTQSAALEGALATSRQNAAGRRGVPPIDATAKDGESPALESGDVAALRQAISDIGTKVARMVDVLEHQPANNDAPGNGGASLPDRVRALQRKASSLGAAE